VYHRQKNDQCLSILFETVLPYTDEFYCNNKKFGKLMCSMHRRYDSVFSEF